MARFLQAPSFTKDETTHSAGPNTALRRFLGVCCGLAALGVLMLGADHWGTTQVAVQLALVAILGAVSIVLIFAGKTRI